MITVAAPLLPRLRDIVGTQVSVYLTHPTNQRSYDKEVVLAAVTQDGTSLNYAADAMKHDKEFVLAAVKQNGTSLNYAADAMKHDKEFVLAAVKQNGRAIEYVADNLKTDKEVVLAAVSKDGEALKFASDDLKQDPDCLRAAGLWFEVDKKCARSEKGIFSLKFGLNADSSSYSNDFVKATQQDVFLSQFEIFNPTTRRKASCDPEFTDPSHPCRGTLDTCKFSKSRLIRKEYYVGGKKKLCDTACWRFAFRFRQEECRDTNGFMIQVEESVGLGPGQKVETTMAKEVGIKVFRTYADRPEFRYSQIHKISRQIQEWYQNGCVNMDLENVYIGESYNPDNPRPLYEEFAIADQGENVEEKKDDKEEETHAIDEAGGQARRQPQCCAVC